MRVRTYIELTQAYNFTTHGLGADDITNRNVLLERYNYSVIVEGEYMELENLEKWANENVNEVSVNQIWYGKTDYNFGLVEFFFEKEESANDFSAAAPLIYTTYPHSYPPGLICRSDGENNYVLYDSKEGTAIVFSSKE